MLLTFARKRNFTDYEKAAFRRLSERTADAITRSGLLVAEQAARRRSDVLHGIAALLNTRSDARGVGQALLARLVPATGLTDAVVALFDQDHLEPLATSGRRASDLSREEWQLAKRAIVTGRVLTGGPTEDAGTVIAAPLITTTGATGVAIATLPKGFPAGAELLDFFTTVGRMAGAALDRTVAYERDHRVAKGLQEGMLGRSTATAPNLATSAGYRAAETGMAVGGDWYDIVPLPDGRLLLTVGDVVGHGLESAAVMGQLRSAVATLGAVVEGPGRLLDVLSRFADTIAPARYATVAVAVLDPDTGEVLHAPAGHPPPLVVDDEGARYLWAGRSEPLACREAGGRPQARMTLAHGASIVLYTDGLVERRSEVLDEGFERLRAVAAGIRDEPPEDQSDLILDAMLDGAVRHDDAVALTAMIRAVPVRVFHHELRRDPAELAGMRRAIRAWLREVDADEATAEELILVVNEAAANAVEHGGGGGGDQPVQIRLAYDPRATRFDGSIVGAGRWLVRPQGDRDRGHGLGIIRSLTDEIVLERRGGTALAFRRTERLREPADPATR
jgi:anti-sigma regulatory factor (Ser/Thr protein kinase)